MTLHDLEQRVNALEREVALLKATNGSGGQTRNWESVVGMFSGDEMMKRIDEHARRFREEDRRKARRRPAKRKVTKS